MHCEYWATGAVRSCTQTLEDSVLTPPRSVNYVCSVCYDTCLEWGLLLVRELNDNNEPVGPSSVMRIPVHESFFRDPRHMPTAAGGGRLPQPDNRRNLQPTNRLTDPYMVATRCNVDDLHGWQ